MIRGYFIVFFLWYNFTSAQDVHYSQFDKTKQLLNPALISTQNDDYEMQLQRRSQWSSVTTPFKTFSLSFNVKEMYKNLSLSATVLNDVAGDSHFSTDGISISLANRFKTKDNLLAVGIQSAFYQRSVNYDGLVFFENENLQNTKYTFFDIGLGIINHKILDTERSLLIALSTFHLNKPNQSLTSNKNVVLNPKYVFYTKYYSILNPKMNIYPGIYASSQDQDKELIIGSGISYKLNDDFDLKSGIYSRVKDAIFITLGIQKENLEVMVSYDVNTSSLATASNSLGGFEVTIIYGWSIVKETTQSIQKICPKYL